MEENERKEDQEWQEKYCNKKIVDLSKILSKEEIDILKKLEITIEENKMYTEHELDEIYMELSKFDDDTSGIYGNETPEEIKAQFEKIINDECHSKREKTLINMYYIECTKNMNQEKPKEEKLENTKVSKKEYENIMEKFDEIGRKYML